MKKKLSKQIKAYVEYRIENLQSDEKELEEYKADLLSLKSYIATDMPSSHSKSRSVENAAVKLASDKYIIEMEKNIVIIKKVLSALDETEAALIDMVYIKKSHSVEGAALRVNLSKTAAYDRVNNILFNIAAAMGIVNIIL